MAEVVLFLLLYQAGLDLLTFTYISLFIVLMGIVLLAKTIRSK